MAGFSEDYRAFKRWQTEDRTPEQYSDFLIRKAIYCKMDEMIWHDNMTVEEMREELLEFFEANNFERD